MAKRKSDYLKMMELGEWLEGIFKRDIQSWQYERLFRDAKQILSLNLGHDEQERGEPYGKKYGNQTVLTLMYITDNSLEADSLLEANSFYSTYEYRFERIDTDPHLLEVARDILSVESEKFESLLGWSNFDHMEKIQRIRESVAPMFDLNLKRAIQERLAEFNEELPEFIAVDIAEVVYIFIWLRSIAKGWLKRIVNENNPLDKRFTSLIRHDLFTQFYNGIQPLLQYQEELGFEKAFMVSGDYEKAGGSFDQVEVIFCRIFIDFLLLGGLEYYGFCEHCDNFFLAQRKGRKKYCSDSCRVEHFREQHSD